MLMKNIFLFASWFFPGFILLIRRFKFLWIPSFGRFSPSIVWFYSQCVPGETVAVTYASDGSGTFSIPSGWLLLGSRCGEAEGEEHKKQWWWKARARRRSVLRKAHWVFHQALATFILWEWKVLGKPWRRLLFQRQINSSGALFSLAKVVNPQKTWIIKEQKVEKGQDRRWAIEEMERMVKEMMVVRWSFCKPKISDGQRSEMTRLIGSDGVKQMAMEVDGGMDKNRSEAMAQTGQNQVVVVRGATKR